jgi:hypothetical protein
VEPSKGAVVASPVGVADEGVVEKDGVSANTSAHEIGVSSELPKGGVVSEEATSGSPEIAKVNIHEQLIKLSEISRLEVYVAPVTEVEPSPTADPAPFQDKTFQETTPPQQHTTPSLHEALSQPVQVIGSLPVVTPPPLPIATPPQVLGSLSSVLEGEVPLTSSAPGVCGPDEDEGEEPVYSLRSKKGKPPKRKPVERKTASALPLPKVVPSESGEINYDDYLDQLVEEEEEPVGSLSLSEVLPVLPGNFPLAGGHSPSLNEQLSEDFPVINSSRSRSQQPKEETLQSLVGMASHSRKPKEESLQSLVGVASSNSGWCA